MVKHMLTKVIVLSGCMVVLHAFRGKGKRNTLVKLADDDEVCTDEGHLLMTIVKITHTLIVMIFSLGS